MSARHRIIVRAAAAAFAALGAWSAPAAASPLDARFDAFVARLKPQAAAAGVSPATFDRAFRGLKVDQEAIAKSQYQPEFRTTMAQYVDTRVSDTRVAAGRQNYEQWKDTLARLERSTGVDRYVILSVWGMETNYGASMGNHNVIEALATLACCQTRRPEFFRKELIAALQILQQGHVSPENMIGSWAGAMGHTQFMPTSFKAYAADYNGDGKRDIWTSIPDALASTANYLKKHGWHSGYSWGYEVAPGGSRRVDGGALPAAASKRFAPVGPNGPTFMLTGNFRVIKRYNNADSYALAVGHLADRIRGGGPIRTPWPNHDKPLEEQERFELQALLARRGFAVGEPDGKIGPATREAIMSYQQAQGLAPDGYAGVSLLRRLRTAR
ncbi:lytic murein transglycosylase [Methylopila turkensis]|uniref:Murein transglycosylase n=1 Tax=Methylopila turkensis TaxID=1437816 RepID=A0A9W6N5N1_9HYPH|nr:lytic murein transglycosylase [Methylopila turkensis]GLK79359.1 murein transglycosylase [Methylopila turkensis]